MGGRGDYVEVSQERGRREEAVGIMKNIYEGRETQIIGRWTGYGLSCMLDITC